jgi:SAM-dependent methyltransferase
MDLRPYGLSDTQISHAQTVLNYQPFRISDTIVTGVAHSWLHETKLAGRRPQLVFNATRDPPDRWTSAVEANERLDRSYEAFLDAIVGAAPGGTYLDVCCNSGYFPVRASVRGMVATGVDAGNFTEAVALLNKVLGVDARFVHAAYEPTKYAFAPEITGQFDVVSCMAFLIHIPEPLHLLRYIADRARRAVFLWSAFPHDDAMFVRYPKLHQITEAPFPWGFDAGVAISDSLLLYSMSELGFPNAVEIQPPANGWPPVCGNPLMAPFEPMRGFLFTRSAG